MRKRQGLVNYQFEVFIYNIFIFIALARSQESGLVMKSSSKYFHSHALQTYPDSSSDMHELQSTITASITKAQKDLTLTN